MVIVVAVQSKVCGMPQSSIKTLESPQARYLMIGMKSALADAKGGGL